MSVVKQVRFDWGEDAVLEDQITSDGQATGTPVNVTAYAMECVIHADEGDGEALFTYTTAAGDIDASLGNGELTVTIPAADVESLVEDYGVDGGADLWYYIRRTDSGARAVLTRGELHIEAI